MTEQFLRGFVPDEAKVQLRTDPYFVEAVDRIIKVLSPELIWKFFSSTPEENNGIPLFPYGRPDMEITRCSSYMELYNQGLKKEYYDSACLSALKALIWMEIGFDGLEEFAKSPEAQAWPLALHKISSNGEPDGQGEYTYNVFFKKFAELRRKLGITDDYFGQLGCEYLLDKF
jgi:hypothetical protein